MVEKTLKLENVSTADFKVAMATQDALARYSEETAGFVIKMDRIKLESGVRKVADNMAGERNAVLVRFGNLALAALDKHNDEAALLAIRTGMNAASLRDVGAARAIDAAAEAVARMVSGASAGPQDRIALFTLEAAATRAAEAGLQNSQRKLVEMAIVKSETLAQNDPNRSANLLSMAQTYITACAGKGSTGMIDAALNLEIQGKDGMGIFRLSTLIQSRAAANTYDALQVDLKTVSYGLGPGYGVSASIVEGKDAVARKENFIKASKAFAEAQMLLERGDLNGAKQRYDAAIAFRLNALEAVTKSGFSLPQPDIIPLRKIEAGLFDATSSGRPEAMELLNEAALLSSAILYSSRGPEMLKAAAGPMAKENMQTVTERISLDKLTQDAFFTIVGMELMFFGAVGLWSGTAMFAARSTKEVINEPGSLMAWAGLSMSVLPGAAVMTKSMELGRVLLAAGTVMGGYGVATTLPLYYKAATGPDAEKRRMALQEALINTVLYGPVMAMLPFGAMRLPGEFAAATRDLGRIFDSMNLAVQRGLAGQTPYTLAQLDMIISRPVRTIGYMNTEQTMQKTPGGGLKPTGEPVPRSSTVPGEVSEEEKLKSLFIQRPGTAQVLANDYMEVMFGKKRVYPQDMQVYLDEKQISEYVARLEEKGEAPGEKTLIQKGRRMGEKIIAKGKGKISGKEAPVPQQAPIELVRKVTGELGIAFTRSLDKIDVSALMKALYKNADNPKLREQQECDDVMIRLLANEKVRDKLNILAKGDKKLAKALRYINKKLEKSVKTAQKTQKLTKEEIRTLIGRQYGILGVTDISAGQMETILTVLARQSVSEGTGPIPGFIKQEVIGQDKVSALMLFLHGKALANGTPIVKTPELVVIEKTGKISEDIRGTIGRVLDDEAAAASTERTQLPQRGKVMGTLRAIKGWQTFYWSSLGKGDNRFVEAIRLKNIGLLGLQLGVYALEGHVVKWFIDALRSASDPLTAQAVMKVGFGLDISPESAKFICSKEGKRYFNTLVGAFPSVDLLLPKSKTELEKDMARTGTYLDWFQFDKVLAAGRSGNIAAIMKDENLTTDERRIKIKRALWDVDLGHTYADLVVKTVCRAARMQGDAESLTTAGSTFEEKAGGYLLAHRDVFTTLWTETVVNGHIPVSFMGQAVVALANGNAATAEDAQKLLQNSRSYLKTGIGRGSFLWWMDKRVASADPKSESDLEFGKLFDGVCAAYHDKPDILKKFNNFVIEPDKSGFILSKDPAYVQGWTDRIAGSVDGNDALLAASGELANENLDWFKAIPETTPIPEKLWNLAKSGVSIAPALLTLWWRITWPEAQAASVTIKQGIPAAALPGYLRGGMETGDFSGTAAPVAKTETMTFLNDEARKQLDDFLDKARIGPVGGTPRELTDLEKKKVGAMLLNAAKYENQTSAEQNAHDNQLRHDAATATKGDIRLTVNKESGAIEAVSLPKNDAAFKKAMLALWTYLK